MQANISEKYISAAAADKLISAHDGDLALLYIFMQRTGSHDLEQAAGELCRTLREIEAAYEKLSRMGLAAQAGEACERAGRQAPVQRLLPPNEIPEYRTEDLVQRSREDPGFTAILNEAEKALGHKLSTPEMKKLFGFYDYLGLPPEVVMMLLNYCRELSCGTDGMGKPPTIRYIEREAFHWADLEIHCMEQAEEYISRSKQHREAGAKVAELLGIRGRKLVTTERRYIDSWLDMGFGPEVINVAFDRTVTNTGALKWNYMNSILAKWKERGLMTVEEIEEKDSRKRPAAQKRQSGDKVDFSGLDAMFKEI